MSPSKHDGLRSVRLRLPGWAVSDTQDSVGSIQRLAVKSVLGALLVPLLALLLALLVPHWFGAALDKQAPLSVLVEVLIVAGLSALCGLWIALRFARRLHRPLQALCEILHRFDPAVPDAVTAEFDLRPPPDEIAELTRQLLRLAEHLRKHHRHQQRLNVELERVLAGREGEVRRRTEESEQRRRELESAVTAAQNAALAKTAFLATMSHELRTPLTSIIGFSDRLLRAAVNNDGRRAAEVVQSAAQHMLGLISDLLDVARIETGRFSVTVSDFDPVQLLADVIAIQRPLVEAKGLAFEVVVEARLPLLMNGDPVRIRQILLNLLGNALKFTDQGSVRLRVWSDLPRRSLRIEVHDTGPGIPPDKLTRLFEPFDQVESGITRRFGGAGIGLYLSREIAGRMGADLTFSSTLGRGSVFGLSLPIPVDQIDGPGQTFESAMRSLARSERAALPRLQGRVLVVEDSPANRELLQHYLDDMGLQASFAADGEEGIQAFLQDQFDLILMDVHMPKVSGIDATRLIRQQDTELPIVALTADLTAQGLQDQRDAGFNETLAKPIEPLRLAQTLQRYLKPGISAPASKPAAEPDDPLRELRLRFIDSVEPDYLLPLRTAQAADDLLSLQRITHRLYGTAGSYGLTELSLAARRLELRLANGPQPDRIERTTLVDEVLLVAASSCPPCVRPEHD